MTNNSVKYEVFVKQYLCAVPNMSVKFPLAKNCKMNVTTRTNC